MRTDQGWVLVTGAAGGIGAAIVSELLAGGHRVVATDTEPVDTSQAASSRLISFALDVTDEHAAAALIERIEREHGAVAGVVTVAGIQKTGDSVSYEFADWRRVIDVNLTGTWVPIRAALPAMVGRGAGRIVTISSEIGLGGAPAYAAYAASKGGVIALTKSLAREYASCGILVNSVAPGPVEAGIFIGERGHNEAWLRANVPLGRFGTPIDIATTVRFLFSGDADFFVGQVISPNGGVVI